MAVLDSYDVAAELSDRKMTRRVNTSDVEFANARAKQRNLLPSDSLRNSRGIDFALSRRPLNGRIEVVGGALLGGAYLIFGVMACVCCVALNLAERTLLSLGGGILGLLIGALFAVSGWRVLANVLRSVRVKRAPHF